MNLQTLQEQLNNPIPNSQPQPQTQLPHKPSRSKSVFIGYLYFVQGIMLSLPSSLILTYSSLPGYDVLSWFAAITLPFSFKFISAPIIEKYTSNSYGRRKTWIIITLLLTSLCIWILSYYTSQEYMMLSAISFIFMIFLISIEDISTDALGIKELGVPELVSYLQTLMQQVGLIFGSFVFIKLTSKSFAETLGLSESLMTPSSYFKMVSLIILIPTILIHFSFQQTLLPQEKEMKEESLFQIFLSYKHFIKKDSKYFRQAIVFLFFYHGFNYFENGYKIEVMKNGFSKQIFNTIENFILLPLMLVTYLFSFVDTTARNVFYLQLLASLRFGWQVLGFLIPSYSTTTLTLYSLIANIFRYILHIRDLNTVNNFPPSALSGMLITGLYSSRNLGVNGSLNLKIISWIGYQTAVILGFCYTLIVILMIPRMTAWIERGSSDLKRNRVVLDPLREDEDPLKQN